MSHVLVPLAQGCEELEAITITDLLVRAGITVTTCGLDEQPVTASRGTTIIPDTSIDKVINQSFDLIVLPGGLPGADHLRDNEQLQTLLKKQALDDKYIAAICAAPKALAQAGILDGKTATSLRTILQVRWCRRGPYLLFFIKGDGFLKNMVRIIVGTLVDFGRGKYPPQKMHSIITARLRTAAGITAPAHGLVLRSVDYRVQPGISLVQNSITL